jgi:energy-converting hydrogenase A subunit R
MQKKWAQNNKRIFITDCEGPISKNDNAFELAKRFISDGDKFFSLISKYDDVLADVIKKEDYKAGDTLRLILPFMKAFGITDKQIRDFSAKNILLVPGAKNTLTFVKNLMPSFIVSTSYEHYISALCRLTGFSFKNTFCTRLKMNDYQISNEELTRLKELVVDVVAMPMIKIPKNAVSLKQFSNRDQETIERLDYIFWKEVSSMEIGKMLFEINPLGGTQKANSVKKIVEKMKCSFDCVMYIGDSITDALALKLVKENGGLAVSFNGNSYSIRESDIAVISANTIITSILAEVFNRLGKAGVFNLIDSWNPSGLKKYCAIPQLREKINALFLDSFPKIEKITAHNMENMISESSVFRKTVRGEAIGRLG